MPGRSLRERACALGVVAISGFLVLFIAGTRANGAIETMPQNVSTAFTRGADAVIQYRQADNSSQPASVISQPPASQITSAPANLGTFNIVIQPDANLAANAPALAAFNRAADQWEAYISDPIVVTVNASIAPLGTNIIGSTSTVGLQASYNTIRNQMVAAADGDDGILASTPTAAQFTASLPSGASLNGNLQSTKAALKAMGFGGLDSSFGVSDGTITFSSNFAFDYDRSNGITPGTMDFETVAAHEIGHLLGFISVVDEIDFGQTSVQPQALDILRFRNQAGLKPTTAAQFTTMSRSLFPGADEVTSDVASEYRMATGLQGGDGTQASHWKADDFTGQYIGIMDPTLSFGQVEQITAADLRALDLIGYDINMSTVPEPSALIALGIALVPLLMRRDRRGGSCGL